MRRGAGKPSVELSVSALTTWPVEEGSGAARHSGCYMKRRGLKRQGASRTLRTESESRTNLKSEPQRLFAIVRGRRAQGLEGLSPQNGGRVQQVSAACPVPWPEAVRQLPGGASGPGTLIRFEPGRARARKEFSVMYIRVLSEPFSLTEVIETQTRQCQTSCSKESVQEAVSPERTRRPHGPALTAEQKR